MGVQRTQPAQVANKVLIHVDTSELVADVISGKPYKFPPYEPVELPAFVANAVIKHIGHLYGMVEVNQVRGKQGIQWDVDEALDRAETYLEQCEKDIVTFYVRQQMEDRVAGGKPALPPTGRALQIILNRKISLRQKFGLSPVGWSDPDSGVVNTASVVPDQTEQVKALHGVLSQQSEVITQQNEMIAALKAGQDTLVAQVKDLMNAINPPLAGEAEEEPEQA